jgi:predicted MFS family arabinose efflux permease
MNRNVWLLFACQALMNSAIVGQVAMAALIGNSLAVNKSFATLPFAVQMLGTMSASIPAGIVFSRLGRRSGFMLGALFSLIGSLGYAYGVWRQDFWLYTLAAVPAGMGFGIAQHYRFAAAEVASAQARPRAIALVMAGGVLAALFGPRLVIFSKDLIPPLIFLGTYLLLAVLPVICVVLLTFTALPPPPRPAVHTPLAAILARPDFITAVVAALAAYGAMNFVMTATPLQMMLCGFGVDDSARVIGWHAVAMYAPGFVTGPLIQRIGVHRVVVGGGLLMFACVLANLLLPASYGNFVLALMLLGVGWNFMFVGATALLAASASGAERVRAQAANDFIVFGTVTITALSSGAMLHAAGWGGVNGGIVAPVALALALVLWQRARRTAVAGAA